MVPELLDVALPSAGWLTRIERRDAKPLQRIEPVLAGIDLKLGVRIDRDLQRRAVRIVSHAGLAGRAQHRVDLGGERGHRLVLVDGDGARRPGGAPIGRERELEGVAGMHAWSARSSSTDWVSEIEPRGRPSESSTLEPCASTAMPAPVDVPPTPPYWRSQFCVPSEFKAATNMFSVLAKLCVCPGSTPRVVPVR